MNCGASGSQQQLVSQARVPILSDMHSEKHTCMRTGLIHDYTHTQYISSPTLHECRCVPILIFTEKSTTTKECVQLRKTYIFTVFVL